MLQKLIKLLKRAEEIRDEVKIYANSHNRVGGVMVDTVNAINDENVRALDAEKKIEQKAALNYCAKGYATITALSELDDYSNSQSVGMYGFWAESNSEAYEKFGNYFTMYISSADDEGITFVQEITTTSGSKYVRHVGSFQTIWKLVSIPTVNIRSMSELDKIQSPGHYNIYIKIIGGVLNTTYVTRILIVTRRDSNIVGDNFVTQLLIDEFGNQSVRCKNNKTWNQWESINAELLTQFNDLKQVVEDLSAIQLSFPASGGTQGIMINTTLNWEIK